MIVAVLISTSLDITAHFYEILKVLVLEDSTATRAVCRFKI